MVLNIYACSLLIVFIMYNMIDIMDDIVYVKII